MVDDKVNIRIVDFGLSARFADLEDSKAEKRNVGTPAYKAPEVNQMHAVQDGRKIDIFSLGVVLFVMYF